MKQITQIFLEGDSPILLKLKIKIMSLHFLYTVQVDTIDQKIIYNSCLFLFLRHGIQKAK